MPVEDVDYLEPGEVPLPPELERSQPDPAPESEDWAPGTEVATLTAEDIARIKANKPCVHCGSWHARACPRVKRMAWHPHGQLAEVEFWRDGQWNEEHVIWPEQVAEAEQ